ncbi:hypothetical protein ACLOJK_029200 [Asimina triloba]
MKANETKLAGSSGIRNLFQGTLIFKDLQVSIMSSHVSSKNQHAQNQRADSSLESTPPCGQQESAQNQHADSSPDSYSRIQQESACSMLIQVQRDFEVAGADCKPGRGSGAMGQDGSCSCDFFGEGDEGFHSMSEESVAEGGSLQFQVGWETVVRRMRGRQFSERPIVRRSAVSGDFFPVTGGMGDDGEDDEHENAGDEEDEEVGGLAQRDLRFRGLGLGLG